MARIKGTLTFHSKLVKSRFITQEFVDRQPKITLWEARRSVLNVYDALLSELYEAGCRTAAKYFECLAQKEDDLIKAKFVTARVWDDRKLLFKLYDNIRLAECSVKTGPMGMATCLQILYQTVLMLELYDDKYHWLVDDVYRIVVRIAEKHDADDLLTHQIKCRIYTIFAKYLEHMHEHENLVITYYKKALKICRGQSWIAYGIPGASQSFTLHDYVALRIAKCYINYAKSCNFARGLHAVNSARKAIVAIAEVQRWDSKELIGQAFTVKIRFLIDLDRNEEAMDNVQIAEKHFSTDDKFVNYAIELALFKGRCWQHFMEPFKAMLTFKKSLLLSRRHKLYVLEARTLLEIGKLYMKYEKAATKARRALDHAKRIFTALGNAQGVQNTVYAIAQLQAKVHFPELMRIMRSISKNKEFCDIYNLRRWKETCKPFWPPESEHDEDEEIYLQPSLQKSDATLYDDEIAILMSDERDLFIVKKEYHEPELNKPIETKSDVDVLYCLLKKPSA